MNVANRVKYIRRYFEELGVFNTLIFFMQRIIMAEKKLITVKVRQFPYPIFLRNGTYDIHIFHQIFINNELGINYDDNIATIIDCGANIGLSTLWYKRRFPESKIIAIEPADDNYELLRKNTERLKKISLEKTAIHFDDSILKVVDIGEGEASYQVTSMVEPGANVIGEIKCKSIGRIIGDYSLESVDVVKIDVEGSEKVCFLESDIRWLYKVKCCLVEIHDNIFPGLKKDILNILPSEFDNYDNGEYTVIYKRK